MSHPIQQIPNQSANLEGFASAGSRGVIINSEGRN